jgi:hypothetical protein
VLGVELDVLGVEADVLGVEADVLGVEVELPESATLLEVPPEHEPINKQTDSKQLSCNFTVNTQ